MLERRLLGYRPLLSDDVECHCITRSLQMTGYSREEAVFGPTAQYTANKYVSHIITWYVLSDQLIVTYTSAVEMSGPSAVCDHTLASRYHSSVAALGTVISVRQSIRRNVTHTFNFHLVWNYKRVLQRNLVNVLSNSYSPCLRLLITSGSQFIVANTLNEKYSKIKTVTLSLPMTKIHAVGVKA